MGEASSSGFPPGGSAMGGSLNICSENGYDFGIMLFNPNKKKNLEEQLRVSGL